MTQQSGKPDDLLQSLLADDAPAPSTLPVFTPDTDEDEDVDRLINELEALFTQAKRVPFGKKLMIDEEQALALVDRFRTAVPNEVKQAHRVLDEQERILNDAKTEARGMLEERGLLAQLESERERFMARSQAEADRIRAEADRYVRGVLQDLNERLIKIQTSVQNGLDTLEAG